jgi:hypothetical protein
MTNTNVIQRVEHMLKPEWDVAEKNAIIQHSNGYNVFGKFDLRREEHGVTVWFKQDQVHWFSSPKSAVSWCVAEKYNKFDLSREIALADSDTVRLSNDVAISQELLPTIQDRDRRSIARHKLEHKQSQLKQAQERLTKCVNLAKYFQIRGFNDELARTRRQAPNPTNRQSYRKPVWAKD